MTRRGETGLTMVEVLVAAIVLTVGILSVVSIFFATGRLGLRAVRNAEAARLARAIAAYVSRQADPNALPNPLRNSAVSSAPTGTQWIGGALHRTTETPALVWQCTVAKHPTDSSPGAKLYVLTIDVRADAYGDGQFDAGDAPVARFVTQVMKTTP